MNKLFYDDLKEDHVEPQSILEEARLYGRQLEERIDPKPGIYELA